jgi:Fe-S oxidoreductase
MELMLTNNIPGQKNGQLMAWLDGKLIGHVEKIRLRAIEQVKIQRLAVYNYFGGSDYWSASPKDQRIYVDNLVISRKPIGCFISNP